MTNTKNIPYNHAAVLVWLDPGVDPQAEDFDIKAIESHNPTSPEGWWHSAEAARYAYESLEANGKVPWMKVGDILLNPDELKEFAKQVPHGYRGTFTG